jgi:hypothetical protein
MQPIFGGREVRSKIRRAPMSINSAFCPVLQTTVARMADFEGTITRVFCPEYDPSTRSCRVKLQGAGGGPLSQLLERLADGTLDRRGYRCDLE